MAAKKGAGKQLPEGQQYKLMCWFSLKWREALSVSEYSAFRGGDFQGIKVYRSDEDLEAAQGTGSGAAIHRFDEPTRLSLGMVASPQSPLPFRPARSL
jgi:hypothetical protein